MLTSTTLNTRRQQRGITLIEVSIGLIIAAIIAAAAFIAFQNNSRRAEVRDNVRLLTEIISESKQKVGLPTGYTGYTELIARNSGTLETTTNSYGGAITIAADTNERAVLTWPGVPEDQCIDLITGIQEGVERVSAGATAPGTVVKNDLVTPAVPFTIANADTACVDNAPSTIVLTFGRR